MPTTTTDTAVDLLSLTQDLKQTLQALLHESLEPVLPTDIRQRLIARPELYSHAGDGVKPHEDPLEIQPTSATSQEQLSFDVGEREDDGTADDESWVERSLLVDIARWSRHPKSSKSLRRAHLDPHDYSLIALCAGTKTYITPAQRRLFASNPRTASSFLPSHLIPPDPLSSTLSIGHEYRIASRELSAIANVVFSVGGVAGAVWWVCQSSAGMSRELSTLIAILCALVVLFAEIWLYISVSSRVSKAKIAEGEAMRNEVVVGMKGLDDVEGLDVLENRRMVGLVELENAEEEEEDNETMRTNTESKEDIQIEPVTTIPASDVEATTTIRLRRRPLKS